jgi:23S rRNA (uridine2552-2'-O)-methyltransferase
MARYTPKDEYFHRAKRENFVARSIYKLEEIDQKHHVLKKGARVLDLGCSPGSWLQYAAQVIGPRGLLLGYDLEAPRVNGGPQARCMIADVFELSPEQVRAHGREALGLPPDAPFVLDVVLSDMAPKTVGVRDADQARSVALVEKALSLAGSLLASDGVLVAKVFQGRGIDALLVEVRKVFRETKVLKPAATREGSREQFILSRHLRAPASSEGGNQLPEKT